MIDFRPIAAVVACLFCVGITSPAWGQPDSSGGDEFSVIMKSANAAYNAEDYDKAAKAYVRAIQASPRRAEAYRNLARSYFWTGDYARASHYYDVYLQLAPADAKDRKQIKSERQLASSRAGEKVFTHPSSQKLVLDALRRQLDEGRAYSPGGGGAWGLYKSLLRAGYAEPDLADLESRLTRKLLDEFDGLIVPTSNQPVPTLDLEDWKVQLERLDAVRALTDDEAVRLVADRRSVVARACIAMLTGKSGEAVDLTSTAIDKNPDLSFLHWLHVVALMEANRNERALDAMKKLTRQLDETGAPAGHLDYARVLRATILRRLDRSTDAADLYLDVLRP